MNTSNSTTYHTLFIKELSLLVKLGCLEEERTLPQEVRIDLEFRFLKTPQAVSSDNLEDTICYAEISSAIQKFCEGKEFKLIEKLTHDLRSVIKNLLEENVKYAITVHKVKPPVPNLLGGTFYRIADFL